MCKVRNNGGAAGYTRLNTEEVHIVEWIPSIRGEKGQTSREKEKERENEAWAFLSK